MKMQYVLGFYFTPAGCILIEKTEGWMTGMTNGIGGKMEPGESPLDAMIREFREEADIWTVPETWRICPSVYGDNYEMYVFVAHSEFVPLHLNPPRVLEDEGIVSVYGSLPENIETTARWLYWMVQDDTTRQATIWGLMP